jgi:hypothetical protein
MADDIATVLAKNLVVNLQDVANFTSLMLSEALYMDDFFLAPRNDIYAVVVLGASEEGEALISSELYWLPVTIYLVDYSSRDITRGRTLVGEGSTAGLQTVATVVRQSLVRPSPYSGRKPSGTPTTGAYTTQTGVLTVKFDGLEYLGDEDRMSYVGPDDDPADALAAQVAALRLRYMIVDAAY